MLASIVIASVRPSVRPSVLNPATTSGDEDFSDLIHARRSLRAAGDVLLQGAKKRPGGFRSD